MHECNIKFWTYFSENRFLFIHSEDDSFRVDQRTDPASELEENDENFSNPGYRWVFLQELHSARTQHNVLSLPSVHGEFSINRDDDYFQIEQPTDPTSTSDKNDTTV